MALVQESSEALYHTTGRVDLDLVEGLLEPAVLEQAHENTYDLNVNLAVLKHYAMAPLQFNFQIVRLILAKGLMNLPQRDFSLYLYLVPEAYYKTAAEAEPFRHPELVGLVELEGLLLSCRFQEFWARIRSDTALPALVQECRGFDDAVRKYILGVVSLTHRAIRKGLLAQYLDLPENSAELDTFIAEGCWTQQGALLQKVSNVGEAIPSSSQPAQATGH